MIKVKLFDCEHELDLEDALNDFLEDYKESEIVDVKYQMSMMSDGKGQVYSFSAMVIYREK